MAVQVVVRPPVPVMYVESATVAARRKPSTGWRRGYPV